MTRKASNIETGSTLALRWTYSGSTVALRWLPWPDPGSTRTPQNPPEFIHFLWGVPGGSRIAWNPSTIPGSTLALRWLYAGCPGSTQALRWLYGGPTLALRWLCAGCHGPTLALRKLYENPPEPPGIYSFFVGGSGGSSRIAWNPSTIHGSTLALRWLYAGCPGSTWNAAFVAIYGRLATLGSSWHILACSVLIDD